MAIKNRITFTLALISLLLPLVNCGGNTITSVHASSPTQECPLAGNPADGAEQFARGTIRSDSSRVLETGEYLEFASQVCFGQFNVHTSYTLQQDHHVQGVDFQMGSGAYGATEEWIFYVDIDTPDGRHYKLSRQYDKHTDVRGNDPFFRSIHWFLPAGTVISIFRPPVVCITPGTDQPNCPTGQKVELIGD